MIERDVTVIAKYGPQPAFVVHPDRAGPVSAGDPLYGRTRHS